MANNIAVISICSVLLVAVVVAVTVGVTQSGKSDGDSGEVFSGRGMFVRWRKDHLQFWQWWTEIGGGGSNFVGELWAQ
ncbi:hypothetical protein GOBAR_AA00024 [Gossypium barbadense]|uniref:Glycine-rich protein n=1 Tax=Gossypium barbadense TaxID=3634 RepID=A0A2P5YY87_GOSBA|nr:hypothetical protein GOBAR_AA00024 [Gossypium barbadense]